MRSLLALVLAFPVCAGAQTALEADPAEAAYLDALSADLEADGRPSQTSRLIAQAWPVLPDSLRAALGGSPSRAPAWAGSEIAGWWRAQDPLPATPGNEAVAEHLRRVLEAEWRYPDAGVRGFDDRGDVLVRLGEPLDVRTLRSDWIERSGSLLTTGVPDNELWTYGSERSFLFANNGGWREASPLDLLPVGLRTPKDRASPRHLEWSVYSALALRDFGRALAQASRQYSRLLPDLEEAYFDITEAALESGVSVDQYARGFGTADTFTQGPDTEGVDSVILLFEEFETERRFVQRANRYATSGLALPLVAGIPLAVRVARFRASNGGTRLEVAWAPEPGAFVGLEGAHAVRSVATLSEVGRPRGRAFPRVASSRAVPTDAQRAGATVPVQAATLDGLGRDQTVAVQVDVLEGDNVVVRRAVERVGPLRAIEVGPGELLISDPLPHLVPEGAAAALSGASRAEADAARARWRYPYDVVVTGAQVGVYVEAYDLGTEGGRSRYEVVRTVEVERGGERRFVSSSATVSGTSFPTAREFIVLPVGDLEAGDTVHLEGAIRDLVTGREGRWSLSFGVAE